MLANKQQFKNTLQDIQQLKDLYKETNDLTILNKLIQLLTTNYQFNDALDYTNQLIQADQNQEILDPKTHIYVYLNAGVSIAKYDGIKTIQPVLE